jgi:hypothetical protein
MVFLLQLIMINLFQKISRSHKYFLFCQICSIRIIESLTTYLKRPYHLLFGSFHYRSIYCIFMLVVCLSRVGYGCPMKIIIVYVHKKDSGAVERFYGMRLKMGNNVMITRFFVFVVVLCSFCTAVRTLLFLFQLFFLVLILIPTHPPTHD